MNFSFREASPQSNVRQESPKIYHFTDEQLHILEEMRILEMIKPSIEKSNLASHEARYKQLFEELKIPNLEDDEATKEAERQYAFFVKNYAKFGVANKNTLH